MIDHGQIEALQVLIAFCLVAGLTWPISWLISLPFRAHRLPAKLCAMSLLTALWIAMTLPMIGRGPIREGLPFVLAALPWWVAMLVGTIIRMRRSERLQNQQVQPIAGQPGSG